MRKLVLTLIVLLASGFSAYATPLGNGVAGIANDSLQGIVDDHFTDSGIDVADDQSGVAVWTNTDGSASAYEIVYLAGNDNALGLYDDITGATYTFDLTSGVDSVSDVTFEFTVEGYLKVNGSVVSTGWSGNFGFYIDSNGTMRYTEDDMNEDGLTQAVTYVVEEGTAYSFTYEQELADGTVITGTLADVATGDNDWIIAFEDLYYTTSDQDFNDAVFYVKDISPVPEPATLVLLGSGLVGLAFLKRRKS